jgi:uncharacterized membrane protein (UPF0127 family)
MLTNFLLPFIVNPGRPYALRNMRNGRVLAHNVIGAFDSRARRKGLLGRAAFADGQAMVIAPSNAIHTLGMKFPIDVAFVRRDGRILKCAPAVEPWRMAVALRAYAVIELPAGALTRHDTKVGDVMTIVPAVSSVVDTSLTERVG